MLAARAALAGAIAGAFVLAATSSARAAPLLSGDLPRSCQATYSIAPSANDFRPEIEQALDVLTRHTGMTFVQVEEGADITYWQMDSTGPRHDGGQAIGFWDPVTRVVFLTDVRRNMRYPLVLHESMHAIGIGHAGSSDNVSAALLTDRVKLGRQDKTALREVKRSVGCGQLDAAADQDPASDASTGSNVPGGLPDSVTRRPDQGLPSAHKQ